MYTPEGISEAFHVKEYVFFSILPSARVATTLPIMLNTFTDTNPSSGIFKLNVVLGLNGFG
jgi:hypothetical protein